MSYVWAPMAQDIDKQQQPTSPDRATPSNGPKATAAGAALPRGGNAVVDSVAAPVPPPSPPTPQQQLKFSIDRILSPEFGPRANGRHQARARKEAAAARREAAATDSSGDDARGKADLPTNGAKAPGTPGLLWPAWVYCTRYSDRPSSGGTLSSSLCLGTFRGPSHAIQANGRVCRRCTFLAALPAELGINPANRERQSNAFIKRFL